MASGNEKNHRVRVAQYLRMSTDHQQYSLHNQSEYIKDYAEKNNMEIAYTYDDAGKSGVSIVGRHSLQQLLSDVEQKKIDIQAVLFYDVSRFGRFQNSDEAAYYSFLFERNGVDLIYCSEPIPTKDFPLESSVILNIKRSSAAYHSRNLSEKVFIGQVNLIKLGYHQGGMAGYGLRRLLVDENGIAKEILNFRKRKSIQTDRVILIPGPKNEIKIVNRIYDLFIDSNVPEFIIAERLNEQSIPAENGTSWTRAKIKFLNPRTRNKVVHEEIKESIKKRGLSKPISVRAIDEDDFKYALICGQGRIEALVALGETIIPAIIRDVSEEDAYVMSLVENIARRRPRSNELLQVIKDMKIRGLSDSEISEITGYSSNWVSSINMLLDKGEHKLLSAVERGNLPLYLAVQFARCETEEAQDILTEAYDKKLIKSRDIIKIKYILNQRTVGNKGAKAAGFYYHKPSKRMTAEELIELYENSIAEHKSVYNNSKFIKTNLLIINEIFNIIMMNKSFQNILEQENLSELPSQILNPVNKEVSK